MNIRPLLQFLAFAVLCVLCSVFVRHNHPYIAVLALLFGGAYVCSFTFDKE